MRPDFIRLEVSLEIAGKNGMADSEMMCAVSGAETQDRCGISRIDLWEVMRFTAMNNENLNRV
jgi:hypothetical protein